MIVNSKKKKKEKRSDDCKFEEKEEGKKVRWL